MSIKEKLIGTTWSLVSFESLNKDGQPYYPLGENAEGYIVFDQTGLFSVQIMAIDNLAHNNGIANSGTENQMISYGYHAYSGFYQIDENKATMTTSVQLSLIKEYRGSQQKRSVKIEDDYLYLSNIAHPERRLVWQRKF